MSSISSLTGMPPSPLTSLQNQLTSEVSAGTISSSDESALSSALSTINSELQSDALRPLRGRPRRPICNRPSAA